MAKLHQHPKKMIKIILAIAVVGTIAANNDICSTKTCKGIGERIKTYQNLNLDPCLNIDKYICDNYDATQEMKDNGASEWYLSKGLKTSILNQGKSMIESIRNSPNASDIPTLLLNYFDSCQNAIDQDKRLKDVFHKVGVTQSGSNINWNTYNYDWQDFTIALFNEDITDQSVLRFTVNVDPNETKKHIVIIDTPHDLFPRGLLVKGLSDAKVQSYINLVKDSFQELYPSLSQDKLTIIATKVVTLEHNLAKISMTRQQRYNDHKSQNNPITWTELDAEQVVGNSLNYVNQLIQAVGAKSQVDINTKLNIRDLKYLKQLANVLANEDQETIIIHHIWRVIKNRIKSLPLNFQKLFGQFESNLYGKNYLIEDTWKQCLQNIGISKFGNVLELAAGIEYQKRYYNDAINNKVVEYFNLVKEGLNNAIDKADWMDEESKEQSKEKLKNFRALFLRNPYLTIEKVIEYYKGLILDENDFFENERRLERFDMANEFELLNADVLSTLWKTFPPMSLPDILFRHDMNYMLVTLGAVQDINFNVEGPEAFNFAGFVYEMAKTMARIFGDTGRFYSKDGSLNNLWTDDTNVKFDGEIKCLVDQYSKVYYKDVNLTIDGQRGLNVILKNELGLSATLYAFDQYLGKHPAEKNVKITGIESLSPIQQFFNILGTNMCSQYTQNGLKDIIVREGNPPRDAILRLLFGNELEASKAFNCNSVGKSNCKLWKWQ